MSIPSSDTLRLAPMKPGCAAQIARWTYGGPYSIYDFEDTQETLSELLNGDYYTALDESGVLTGYFCYGGSARIPTVEPDIYDGTALDMGLGMRPDLCGAGRGAAFVCSGLDFARARFDAERFRLTVAAFNTRAIRAYEKAGFEVTSRVTHGFSHQAFLIMHLVPC